MLLYVYGSGTGPVPPKELAQRGTEIGGALALDDDWPDVLAALRRGLKDPDAAKASRQRLLMSNSSTVGSFNRRRTNSHRQRSTRHRDHTARAARQPKRRRLAEQLGLEHPG
jgi:hypothetical protein